MAKAGSYSTIAIAAPSRAQAAYSCHGSRTSAHSAKPAAASSEPPVISARPWPRSITAPAEYVASPHTARPSVKAPISVGLLQPSSAIIGNTKEVKP